MEARMYEMAKLLLESDTHDDDQQYEFEIHHDELGEFAYWLQLDRFHRRGVIRRQWDYAVDVNDWRIPEVNGEDARPACTGRVGSDNRIKRK